MPKTTCAICGKEISSFQNLFASGSGYLDEINSAITICAECNKQKIELITNSKEMNTSFRNAEKYFKNYIDNGPCNAEARDYIDRKIRNFNDTYNAKIEGTADDPKIKAVMKQLPELLKNFKATTGLQYDGYKIVEYKDIVYDQIVLGTGIFSELNAGVADILGATAKKFEDKIDEAKSEVLKRLKIKAVAQGCNAIIGTSLDLTTFSGNMIAVSGNATGVIIKKQLDL